MKTLEEILEYVKKCGCSVQYDAPPYYIQQAPEEISALLFELLKTNNYSNFLEIGSAGGGATKLFNDFFHFKKMVLLDNNRYKKLAEIREKQLAGLPFVEFIGNSQSAEARNFVKNQNMQFDILLIDGDHSYAGVKNDYNNFSEFVKKDGYLIFHDTVSYPDVGRFVNELKLDKNLAFINDYRGGKEKVCGLALFKKTGGKFGRFKNTIEVFVKKMEHYDQNIQGWSNFAGLYTEMVNKYPDGSHFVEIGSWNGKSAVYMGVEIFNSGKNIKFDCVDNWKFDDEIYSTHLNLVKLKKTAFQEFLKNIEPLSGVINYHKMDSVEASKLYTDGSLDFVFIDGSHEYENVKNDLINWFPKVKPGGVLAGHDYCLDELHGVKLAVDEFFKGKKFEIRYKTTWIHYKKMDANDYIAHKFKIDLSEKSPIYIEGTRLELPPLFNELGYKTGAEIGVFAGDFSEALCKSNPDLKLYSIDAWTFYPTHNNFRRQRHLDTAFETAKNRLSAYPNSVIIKKWSMDAVPDFPDESLDFVFIDGNHEFQYITNDIAEWSKKVKKGGIVSGHDYGRSHDRQFGNVKDVVLAWTSAKVIRPWFVFETPEYMNNRESPDYRETSWMWVKT